jgi:hypothetical protein
VLRRFVKPSEHLAGDLFKRRDLFAGELVEEQLPDGVDVSGRGGLARALAGRSNDFPAMETYPEITFISTGVRQTGDGEWSSPAS